MKINYQHLPCSLLLIRETVILIFISFICFSCGKEKVIILPEISHSDITELNDVSAAYLFYDETKPDSVELNRKNLISTTNWLINVDKRLTLKQVIPHIKFLQEKKANSSHKNRKAKNYFTCNDTSRKELGFIEFTNTNFLKENLRKLDRIKKHKKDSDRSIYLKVITLDSIAINFSPYKDKPQYTNNDNLKKFIQSVNQNLSSTIIELGFNSDLTFQNYINMKSTLSSFDIEYVKISDDEFISN